VPKQRVATMTLGSTRLAPNGYHYTKVQEARFNDGEPYWRLTHHIYMEKYLGRQLLEGERVHFNSDNKQDFSQKNLRIVMAGTTTIRKKLAQLYAKRTDLEKDIKYWEGLAVEQGMQI